MSKISGFIFRHGGNILDADQHTDLETGVFLARMEWDLEGFEIPHEQIASRFQPLAQEHPTEPRGLPPGKGTVTDDQLRLVW